MSTNAHLGKIQRLAGDIADRYPDADTHNVTQDLIAHATALEAERDRLQAYAAHLESEVRRLSLAWDEETDGLGDAAVDQVIEEKRRQYRIEAEWLEGGAA